MKQFFLLYFITFLSQLVFGCSCTPKPYEYYDFIALVTICNNEPGPNSYSDHIDYYQSEFEIKELYKGAKLNHVLAAGYYTEVSEAACGIEFNPAEEWIIYAKYESYLNDFMTSYCSYNKQFRMTDGFRNWERKYGKVIKSLREKYMGLNPNAFLGDSLFSYYTSGNVEFFEPYKNGKLHGNSKRFYPSGKIYKIENHKIGELNGIQKTFSKKGTLRKIENYKTGNRHGTSIRFYKDGSVSQKTIYHHNQIAVRERYYFKVNQLKEEIIFDFSTCTKTKKRWTKTGIINDQSISYHNGNRENFTYNYKGKLASKRSYNAITKKNTYENF